MYDNNVRDIMHKVVAPNSKDKYNNANINLMLWLYSKPEYRVLLFPPVYLEELDRANERQQLGGEKNSIRKVVKRFVQEMSPDLDNCPLLLENLTFEFFSEYMVSKKQTKGDLREKQDKKNDAVLPGTMKNTNLAKKLLMIMTRYSLARVPMKELGLRLLIFIAWQV